MSTPTQTIEARNLRRNMQLAYRPSELTNQDQRAMFLTDAELCGTILRTERLSLAAGERIGVTLALGRSLVLKLDDQRTIEVPDVSPMVAQVPRGATFRNISIE